jgi:ATP-dependent exoDNAse (exonuclease V) beta subunit
MPYNENAFKIMTIHKSKGLESKVIIIPFCNWDLYKSKNILWCVPNQKPFSDMPLVSVNIKNLLANTIFSEDYFEEIMNQYIDNLNLAYVGFTRSRNELFLPLPTNAKSESKEIKISKINDLIYSCLTHNEELQSFWTEENIFEMGEMQIVIDRENNPNERLHRLTDYPIVPCGERLQIHHTAIETWETTSILDTRLNYGLLMHEILQNTRQKGDDEKIIAEMMRQGKLNENEAETIHREMVRFWSLPETENWFDKETEVLNEATILLPGGVHFRPDRIVLKNQSAIVVDYKFGNEHRNDYSNQLKQYADLIRQMGYQVEAWLYYVSLGELLKIE